MAVMRYAVMRFAAMRHSARLLAASTLVALTLAAALAPPSAAQPRFRSSAGLAPKRVQVIPDSTPRAQGLWRQFYVEEHLAPSTTDPSDTHPEAVAQAYLKILERWAAAPSPDVVELIAELDFRLLQERRCFSSETRDVLTFMGGSEPDAILPAVTLHVHAWRHRIQHRRFVDLDRSVEHIEELVGIHVSSRNDSPSARRDGADLLTYLGEYIWESGYLDLHDLALSVLGNALELDPKHLAARFLRVMLHEQAGRYRAALEDLEVLHRQHPLQGDIALRLAIQLVRRDQPERAARLLDTLMARGGIIEDWIHAVAFQERIRLAAAQSSLDLARELAARALESHPENTRLRLMDIDLGRRLTGRADPRSQELLDQWNGDVGVTPRLIYLQSPKPTMDANRERLAETLNAGTEALTRGARTAMVLNRESSSKCGGVWRRLTPDPSAKIPMDRPREVPGTSTSTSTKAPAVIPREVPSPREVLGTSTSSTSTDDNSTGRNSTGTVYIDEATGQAIRVDEVMDLDLQQLYVTPSRLGRRSVELSADRIALIDDGRSQDIVTFEQGDIPFTATLLIDASGSMQGPRIATALRGVRKFVDAMAPLDRTRVVLAADRLRGASPFVEATGEGIDSLTAHLDRTAANGGTALFDHLFLTLDALEPEQGRKVVVVLSDGYDQMSALPMESIRGAMQRSQIQLYWVRLREVARGSSKDLPPTGWRSIDQTRRQLELLERTVKESGGRTVDIDHVSEVGAAFSEILDDLRSQIAIGYYPAPRHGDGRWREIEVKAKGLGIRLRHAAGYFDG